MQAREHFGGSQAVAGGRAAELPLTTYLDPLPFSALVNKWICNRKAACACAIWD